MRKDIALVGYNDISISAELPVPLSSVHNNLEIVGKLAVDTLLSLIGGEEPTSQTVARALFCAGVLARAGPKATTFAVLLALIDLFV